MAKASIVVTRLADAVAAMIPVEAIAIGINSGPALEATFEVVVEGEVALARSQGDIVNPNLVHVVVVVTEGNPHGLASVSAEVDGVLTPVVVARSIMTDSDLAVVGLGIALPNSGEVVSSRVGSSSYVNTEVVRIAVVGIVSKEGEDRTTGDVIHLRSNDIVVGSVSTVIVDEGL